MPVTLEIAPARAADTAAIADMSRRLVEVGLPWTWTPARVARHLHHPDSLVIAARMTAGNATPAAFAIMHFGDEIAHLNLLAVHSRWQRRGLGRRLMLWLEHTAITAGTFTMSLEVRARNPVALLFYRALGFEETGRVPRYYSGREDALRLAKDLRHPMAPGEPATTNDGTTALPSAPEWLAALLDKPASGHQ
ncbi:MAG: GNAT family N-acetyltransferase [Gammaproteobacteria bacterium]